MTNDTFVMAGIDPVIHVFVVDSSLIRHARHKAGHADINSCSSRNASDLLIVFADFRMGAQHRVHRLEHVAHSLFGDRAFHHHHKLRLVG